MKRTKRAKKIKVGKTEFEKILKVKKTQKQKNKRTTIEKI